jgi:hypothetical protein
MTKIASMVRIQDLLDLWRGTGSRRLASGAEVIGLAADGDQQVWLHALHAPLPPEDMARLAARLHGPLPADLRALYRVTRGMSLFQGLFRVFGWRTPGIRSGLDILQPDDIVDLNHELDVQGWKPPHAVAFAVNAWDQSVHLFGLTDDPHEVVRCHRVTGSVLEVHESLWDCLAARLSRLDDLFLRA